MGYQIYENGASLFVQNNGRIKLVMKTAIVDVRVVGDNVVKLTFDNPLQSIYLRFPEVDFPQYETANDLRDHITSLISACVCCDCGSTQPQP